MHYPITESQIQFYEENGYLPLPEVITPEELADARVFLEEALHMRLTGGIDRTGSSDYDRVFLQKVNLWRDHEGVRRLVFHPRLAQIARQLSRSHAIRLWHDHALIKMPGRDSRPSPWHQDLPYWPMNEAGALSCWLPLDDVDEHNGCMHFIPGSHRLGKLPPINLVNPQDIFAFVPQECQQRMKSPVAVPLQAGDCTFHNGLTFHYAPPNRGNQPRRALVIIYMPDGTTYLKKPHCVTDDLDLEPSAPLTGDWFPILARA
ncbi:MAG: phytanoyl-CoA dioxygenase family protein [Armatimonadetes bacterium]|nr:phytanoyl-CoA dioxygenase family protein [Armatimonadota bacterium]